jgi:hypothetical protein
MIALLCILVEAAMSALSQFNGLRAIIKTVELLQQLAPLTNCLALGMFCQKRISYLISQYMKRAFSSLHLQQRK